MKTTGGVALTTALSAVAIVVLACQTPPSPAPSARAVGDEGQAGKAADDKTAKPMKSDTVTVEIFDEKDGCGHGVLLPEDKPRLKKNEHDLSWDITNLCKLDQKVVLCAYKSAGTRSNPFHPCKKDPRERDVERIFTVKGNGGKARLDCTARDPGSYVKGILVGKEIKDPDSGCPGGLPEKMRPETHRLDIEIFN